MNPSPLSRLKSDPSPTSSSTPSQPSQSTPSPATPSQPSRASPRLRPNVERGTPRSSRLGQEVFSATAAAEEEDGGEEGEQDELEKMQVDNET